MVWIGFVWLGNAFMWFFSSFIYWLSIFFVLPFKDLEILWILIPIWVNLIFTDFFQEKRGTSMGNAITNGAVMLWVGVDWIRYLVRHISSTSPGFSWILFMKFAICAFVIIIGFMIIIEGVKGKEYIRKVARVRETGYVMLICSPIIYGAIELSFKYFLIAILFFPLFYFVFEMIDQKISSPLEENSNTLGF